MVAHLAHRLLATDTGTGIDALEPDTRPVGGAVGARGALRPAVGRGSLELPEAGADGLLVDLAALGVGAAGGRLTGVHILMDNS